jgi:hypothetical protein
MAAMARCVLRFAATLSVAGSVLVACGRDSASPRGELRASGDLGVEVAQLSPVVDNPYVAFASVRRAVYEGEEVDAETDERIGIRVESIVRDTPMTIAGVEVTVVEVTDFADGELVEKTEDYYAQDRRSGIVYYMGERVDDYEDGRISHGGQWLAGENGNLAGVFMPGPLRSVTSSSRSAPPASPKTAPRWSRRVSRSPCPPGRSTAASRPKTSTR